MGREDECMRGRTVGSRPWPLLRFVPPEELEVRRTDDETIFNRAPSRGSRNGRQSDQADPSVAGRRTQVTLRRLCSRTTAFRPGSRPSAWQQRRQRRTRHGLIRRRGFAFPSPESEHNLISSRGTTDKKSHPSQKEQVIGRVGSSWSRSSTRVRRPFRRTRLWTHKDPECVLPLAPFLDSLILLPKDLLYVPGRSLTLFALPSGQKTAPLHHSHPLDPLLTRRGQDRAFSLLRRNARATARLLKRPLLVLFRAVELCGVLDRASEEESGFSERGWEGGSEGGWWVGKGRYVLGGVG